MFLAASRFNHACGDNNNVHYSYNRAHDCMVFVTKRAIKAGEELLIMYTNNPSSIYASWGFHCQCGACGPYPELFDFRERITWKQW